MPRRPYRAVLLLQPTMDKARSEAQERALLKWADDNRYFVTALASDPNAAAAVAENGLCDVVVVFRHTRATLEMAGRIGQTEATVDEISPGRVPLQVGDSTQGRILDAARRGVPAEAIAAVLDVPLSTVHEALGIGGVGLPGPGGRRPQRTGQRQAGPGQRRPRLVVAPPGRP